MQACRHNQPYSCISHLIELIFRHTFLKGEQVLYGDSVGFIENLSPAIFTCCFSSEHSQASTRKRVVGIREGVGKKKIWLSISLDGGVVCVILIGGQSLFLENFASVIF